MNAITMMSDPGLYCGESLQLRHKVQKLRWMGLEREADQLAAHIDALSCDRPIVVPDIDCATD